MKGLTLLSAVAAASVAATLNAQVKTGKPDSTCTNYPDGRVECRVFRGARADSGMRNRVFYRMDSAMAKRAALGVELRTTGTKRDTLGVFVEAVTPKGLLRVQASAKEIASPRSMEWTCVLPPPIRRIHTPAGLQRTA
jgi:uncharacterized protein YodC (DUF2158 family)